MVGVVKNAITDRLTGKRPAAPRAIVAAAVVGVAAAVITYRVLRG